MNLESCNTLRSQSACVPVLAVANDVQILKIYTSFLEKLHTLHKVQTESAIQTMLCAKHCLF